MSWQKKGDELGSRLMEEGLVLDIRYQHPDGAGAKAQRQDLHNRKVAGVRMHMDQEIM